MSRTGLNPAKDFLSLLYIIRMLKKEKPDLMLTYTIKPVIYGSLGGWVTGVPQLFSMITGLGYLFSAGGFRQRLLSPWVRMALRIALQRNKKIFFRNPDDFGRFQSLGLISDPEKAVVINGSGVDIQRFCPVAFPGNTSFLLIARLLRDKGIIEYVEAVRRIRTTHPHISFKLVGWLDKNPRSISRSQLQAWIDEGVIEFLGRLEDVRSAISGSTVYVLPSYYPEGTPRTILEAMAMGRPIITSDAPGCRETVVNGFNGFLVPVKDPVVLAEKMKVFIEQPQLASQMGQRSRRIAVEKYDVRKVNRVILTHLGLIDEATG